MLNQSAVENDKAASYTSDYLDMVENLPHDVQLLITELRELDVRSQSNVREMENYREALSKTEPDSAARARLTAILQNCLISMQEVGDLKLHTVGKINDLLESKNKILDSGYKNLDFEKSKENNDVNKESNFNSTSNSTSNNVNNPEKPAKRVRRTRTEHLIEHAALLETFAMAESQSSKNLPSTSNGNPKRSAVAANVGKKKKRKARQGQSQQHEEDTVQPDDPNVDPDEPVYCLCEQISYGEMILCDNDLCPIEWFHFSCVFLTTKPKGKWFCPMCRSDKSNTMKPKHQFMKDLAQYKKEKEGNS
ncbi:inhibitor of growth protein 1-like [Trichogramma pretiosum]|uniref:inhibitor of growth protein 1-like n=1 Tax=Trichogramma pretiosum TaxID=7493 RepID=UPI0006C9749A|nr:inhibitor of growth protein 1-like [Trichogramma pretiosum]